MRILVADDHELFLKGLEFILRDNFPGVELVFAHNYPEIFKIIEKETDFNLIMTDLAMPGGRWSEAFEKIHALLPETPIAVLSAVFDKEIVQKTIDIGVSGYIPKTSANAVIISAVNLIMSGGVYIPPELLDNRLKPEFASLLEDEPAPNHILTPRQIEVIQAVAEGKSNKQIAYELGLSEGTVKLHVTAILKLLNVNNRTGAVREAERLGVIRQSVPNWILQENRDLLRNFFHSRQDGGTGFRMAAWTSACRKLEEHLLAGGQIALLTSRLLELQNLFEEEASSVDRRLAEKRND